MTTDRDLALLLIGAGIALVSALVTSIVQHWLSLGADKIKRERTRKDKEAEALRSNLLRTNVIKSNL